MWNYKCHSLLGKLLWPVIFFLHFFLELSWTYAHYRNGRFTEMHGKDNVFMKSSFRENVRSAWHNRREE